MIPYTFDHSWVAEPSDDNVPSVLTLGWFPKHPNPDSNVSYTWQLDYNDDWGLHNTVLNNQTFGLK